MTVESNVDSSFKMLENQFLDEYILIDGNYSQTYKISDY